MQNRSILMGQAGHRPVSLRHDHEGTRKARQAAEALFKPRTQAAPAEVPTESHAVAPVEQQHRKPRILAALPELSRYGTQAAPVEVPADSHAAPSPPEQQPQRTPRILAALPSLSRSEEKRETPAPSLPKPETVADSSAPSGGKTEASAPKGAVPQQARRQTPASKHGRIRTLVTYGMTVEDVAEFFRVPVAEIAWIVSGA
jgi:hypothetical protein